jgi:hypothetical protein
MHNITREFIRCFQYFGDVNSFCFYCVFFQRNQSIVKILLLIIKKVPPQGAGYGKRFARKPLVSIASLYFPPQGAGNYTQIIIKENIMRSPFLLSYSIVGTGSV